MFDRRARNAEIFLDTAEFIIHTPQLKNALAESLKNQRLYLEKDRVETVEIEKKYAETQVIVSRKRSFEAASQYARDGKKVCVLNFASATNPGGGVVNGSSAQEESLCRCSTLYPCLDAKEIFHRFYDVHRRARNPLYNDDCIYTPGVVVCKSDISFPERMDEKDWYKVDVITCAAPNLRERPSNAMNPHAGDRAAKITHDELMELLLGRIERIFAIAATQKEEVLILGAFGCGAFCNPPEVVAKAFARVQKKYEGVFDTIEYAIYCRDYESANYDEFCREMMMC